MKKSTRLLDRGFTLFEVILVLVLISVFAAVAVTRQPHPDTSLRAQSDVLRAHLHYAQMRAMNTDEIWGIGIGGGSAYWLFRGQNDEPHRRRLPGEEQTFVDLGAKGISISCPASAVTFDTWGRPLADDALVTVPFLAVTLSKSGVSQTLDITRSTGFMP